MARALGRVAPASRVARRPPYLNGVTAPAAFQPIDPCRFTSREYDDATGLYYFRARWYDPEAGRFTTRDPMGYADGNNLYQYVSSQPTAKIDPLGLNGTGKRSCVGVKKTPIKIKKSGRIGPISWKVNISVKFEAKVCKRCCPEGTPKACQWVIDNILKVTIKGSASASASSYGGKVGPFSFWAGIKVTLTIGIKEASGTFESDRCNGIEMQGKLCINAFGRLAISGGAGVRIKTWVGTIKIGASITGVGQVTLKKCMVCNSGGCRWLPGKLCLSGKVYITVNAWIISGKWTIWSGSKCWAI